MINFKYLNNPFPYGFSFKYFLDRYRFNPFGFAAMKVENSLFECLYI